MLFQSAALAAFAGVAAAAAANEGNAQHQNGGVVYGGRPAYYPYPDDGDDDGDCPPQEPHISTHSTAPAPTTAATTSTPAPTSVAATTSTSSAASEPFWAVRYTATGTAEIAAAAATAKTESPTSNVPGAFFDRLMIIMFENQDYDVAYGDPNFKYYADRGINLNNSHGHTHPSEPNYMAIAMGDYFGCDNDDLSFVAENVSTIVDLLDDKGISWGIYQEDQPFTGYEGFNYFSPLSGNQSYVRKHNPLVLADSVAESEDRLALLKNLSMTEPDKSMFHKDLAAGTLPQWMFITPNLTSDCHDTDITVGGVWLRNFLDNLVLKDEALMERTLIYITFDEDASYTADNKILSILYGPAIPQELVGTVDNTFYSHYSSMAAAEANWGLDHLGRFDAGANPWKSVADKTGEEVREWDLSISPFQFFNQSYAGPFNSGGGNKQYPAPNLDIVTKSGRKISPLVKKIWENSKQPTYYTDSVNLPTGLDPPKGWEPTQ